MSKRTGARAKELQDELLRMEESVHHDLQRTG